MTREQPEFIENAKIGHFLYDLRAKRLHIITDIVRATTRHAAVFTVHADNERNKSGFCGCFYKDEEIYLFEERPDIPF